MLAKYLRSAVHGYTTHKARVEKWEEAIATVEQFDVNDPVLEDFNETLALDVQDGQWPKPLAVTTYAWATGEGDGVAFGVVAWTRFVSGAGGVKVEAVWIQPVESKEGYMGAFMAAKTPMFADLTDMEEEVVLDFEVEGGLFLFPDHSHSRPLWVHDDALGMVVAPDIVNQRAT